MESGGSPGTGVTGRAGGPSASCSTTCAGILGLGCTGATLDAGQGGHAGGPGGNGATGGQGGDGSGGDAFAYVEGGNASVVTDGFTKNALLTGTPGAIPDGGNGAPGRAATQGP